MWLRLPPLLLVRINYIIKIGLIFNGQENLINRRLSLEVIKNKFQKLAPQEIDIVIKELT